jgi:hypothetical protein
MAFTQLQIKTLKTLGIEADKGLFEAALSGTTRRGRPCDGTASAFGPAYWRAVWTGDSS